MARLKVITLNIWNYNRFDERKHKIIDFLKAEDADIVALQEIRDDTRFNIEGNHQAKQINEALGYPHMAFAETMDLNEVDNSPLLPKRTEGIAVLSKYPLHAKHHVLAKHPDDKYTRGALHCRLETERPVDIIAVHFSPHVLFSELHLIDTLRIIKEKDIEPIILGDFNIYDHKIIRQHAPEFTNSYEFSQYISYPSRAWALDYILLPQQWRFVELQTKEQLSDHNAIIAILLTKQ